MTASTRLANGGGGGGGGGGGIATSTVTAIRFADASSHVGDTNNLLVKENQV